MNYCRSCGSPIPKGQDYCSMCVGDISYGRDGYYEQWAQQQQERYEEERREEIREVYE